MNFKIDFLKNKAINGLKIFLEKKILSTRSFENKQAKLLSYWILDYINFLSKEEETNFRTYKRGDIIQVHLGYRIGSELGGRHYAIVLNKNDTIKNRVLTIIPLKSEKPNSKESLYNLKIANALNEALTEKLSAEKNSLLKKLEDIELSISNTCENDPHEKACDEYAELRKNLATLSSRLDFLINMDKQIITLNNGSIALINQITVCSKLRIVNPVKSSDLLTGIRLSDKLLSDIDDKIIKLYTK